MADRGSPHFGETTGIARAAGAVFFGCAGLVFALVVVGVAALQIAPLRRAALDAALDAVNRGEIKIGVDSIEGRWPDTLALHGLTVSDAKGRWLAVDAASIEWRPTALLLGEVHIARLSVRGLDIARAPESAAPSAGSGPGLPVLPFIVAVDDAKIETLTLGKALADPSAQGRIATIDAKAGFRLTPSHIDLTLAAARVDGAPGRLDAHIFFDQRDRGLDLRIEGEDGATGRPGLVATLAKLQDVDHLTLTASARNDNGRIEADVRIADGAAIALDARAAGRWDTSLDLDTSMRAEGTLVARALADLGGPRALDARTTLHWGRDDRLTLDDLSIEAGALTLKGNAGIAGVSSASTHEIGARGTLDGLDRVLGEPGNTLLTSLDWRIASTLDVKANTVRIAEALVTAGPGKIHYRGEAALDGRTARGEAEAEISDLGPVGAFLGEKLSGRASLHLAPFARDAHGDMLGDFSIRAQSLSFGDKTLDGFAGGEVAADGSLLLPGSGGFALPALTVTPASGLYRFKGDIAASQTGVLSGEAHFTSGDLARLLPGEAAGKAALDARFGGTLDAPKIGLNAKLADGAIAGIAVKSAALDASVEAGGAGPVSFRAAGPEGTAALDAMLVLPPGGGARFEGLTADLFGAKFAGDIALSGEGLASGTIKGTQTRLSPLAALAGLPIGGSGDFALTASERDGKQDLALTLAAPRVTMAAGEASLEHVALSASARDVAGTPDIDGRLSATAGQAGLTRLTSVEAAARGPLSALELTADISGTREGVKLEPVAFKAGALYAGASGKLTVLELRFAIGDHALSLARPATIGFGQGIAARNIAVAFSSTSGANKSGSGSANGELSLGDRSVRLHFETKELPLELITPLFLSQAAHGTASGTVDIDSARGTGELALRFDRVRLAEADEQERPAFDARLDGHWSKGRLDVSARAEGVSAKPFQLNASLPFIRDPKGAWPVPAKRGPVSGSLDWEGPLASLFALTDIQNQKLSGDAKVALTASGDISSPSLSGSANISDGTYENFDSGTVLRDLTISLAGLESRSLHFSLEANDGAKGRLSAAGDVHLASDSTSAVSIGATFSNMRIVRTAEADIAVDGQLDLTGPVFPPTDQAPLSLKGALTTTLAQLRIPDSLPGSIAQIDVIEINGPPSRHAMLRQPTPLPLALDVAVKIGAPARVSGRGLDSLWTGDLTLAGTADATRLSGILTSLRGNFDLAGKSFALTKGSVRFLGRTPIDPTLDMTLTYQRSDLTAAINVTGQSSAPEIALGSTPDLPRDEIMSRILFDKGAGELSATEAVQLAHTLAQLSGKGGFSGSGILDSVQQALGLDVLQMGSAASGATTVSAGKYLRKGVYVGVEQGALANDSSVKVEIEVTPQISVDTRIGQNASGDVGVNWKWDY